jgi:hypothetical protein
MLLRQSRTLTETAAGNVIRHVQGAATSDGLRLQAGSHSTRTLFAFALFVTAVHAAAAAQHCC